jgi:hypothetical protein
VAAGGDPLMERPTNSRWDLLNPTNILATLLGGMALVVYHRPSMPFLYQGYSQFTQIMPWEWWGWTALAIAVLLLLSPRDGALRLLAHSLCGTYMLAVAASFGSANGIAFGVTTFTILAGVSGLLFARTAVHWAAQSSWWARAVRRPPRWLRRLAGVQKKPAAHRTRPRGLRRLWGKGRGG